MKSNGLIVFMFLFALIANNKLIKAQVLDANACPFKSNYTLNRNIPTSDFHTKSIVFSDSIRELYEINVFNQADAYPYLSSDGLRLYYTHQESSGKNIYYTSRIDIYSHFNYKELLSINIPYGTLSCWLTNNELELYFVNNNLLYYSTRTSLTGSFSVPVCVSLVGGNTPLFLSGPSLTPDKQELYIYKLFPGNSYIFKYIKTGTMTYTLNDTLELPVGCIPGPGQLSKDGLKYYLSLHTYKDNAEKLYRLSRPNLNSNFSDLSILDDSINNSYYSNIQPSVSASNNIIVWVRNTWDAWVANDLYIGYGAYSSVKDKDLSKAIRIYPNPAKEKICIEYKETTNAILLIYNIMGDLIIQADIRLGINETDISHLSKGIYIVKINNENSSMQQKLIVQ